jgi:hypothetical protein
MKKALILLVLIFFATACRPSVATQTATPETAAATPTLTDTPAPTGLLLVAGNATQPEIDLASVELAGLAQSKDLTFETRSDLQPGDLQAGWRVVVFLRSPTDVNAYAGIAPQTTMIILSFSDQSGSGNVTYIRLHPEYQAFIAGYIAMLISEDWRSAGLLISDDPTGGRLAEAFTNGAYFYCGSCTPIYPPYDASLPATASLPSTSDANAWRASVDPMIANHTYDMYVMAEAASPDLMAYLASLGMRLFGTSTPSDTYRSNWVVTIQLDPWTVLSEHWNEILAGAAGMTLSADIRLSDIDQATFGEGKQRLVEEVIQQLVEGQIYPYNP